MSEQTMKSTLGGTITVTEQNGLPKFYELTGPGEQSENRHLVGFHTGDPSNGLTGWAIEDLLAISKDRLEKVNPSFPSKFNEFAMHLMGLSEMLLEVRYMLTTAARKWASTPLIVITYNDLGTESMVRTICCKLDELPPAQEYLCIFANVIYHGKTPNELAKNIATANYLEWSQGESNLIVDYMVARAFLALANAYSELSIDLPYENVSGADGVVDGEDMLAAVTNLNLNNSNWLAVLDRLTHKTAVGCKSDWFKGHFSEWIPTLHAKVKEHTAV